MLYAIPHARMQTEFIKRSVLQKIIRPASHSASVCRSIPDVLVKTEGNETKQGWFQGESVRHAGGKAVPGESLERGMFQAFHKSVGFSRSRVSSLATAAICIPKTNPRANPIEMKMHGLASGPTSTPARVNIIFLRRRTKLQRAAIYTREETCFSYEEGSGGGGRFRGVRKSNATGESEKWREERMKGYINERRGL